MKTINALIRKVLGIARIKHSLPKRKEERLIWVLLITARRVKDFGGDRVEQDIAAIYAQQLLKGGRTATHSIQAGFAAAMRMKKDRLKKEAIEFRKNKTLTLVA